MSVRDHLRRCAIGAAGGLLAACASAPEIEPQYAPAASVVEVVAVLQRHVPDDGYRFEAARDFTGRNVYRSALMRLESIEAAHETALRAGHLDDVIAFAKGRAFERLRAFELAAASYRRAAERDGELRVDALRSAAICDALAEAAHTGFDADADVAAEASAGESAGSAPGASGHASGSGAPAAVSSRPPALSAPSAPADAAGIVAASERRVALLEAIRADLHGTHYDSIAREEIERADVARAQYFVASRRLAPDGDIRALAELQRVVERHRESHRASRHLIRLADLHGELAREYVTRHPPESLLFDPATFQDLVDSASRLYEAVGRQDGTPERLEASQRLEALLAFTLGVDGDRFTP